MNYLLVIIAILALVSFCVIARDVLNKHVHIWLWSYLTRKNEQPPPGEPVHIMLAICDHYEPMWRNPGYDVEVEKVNRWCAEYPKVIDEFEDADGFKPRHSYFYPEEEYREEHLDRIAELCSKGYGEIEIHLHHDDDTAEGLTEKLQRFVKRLDENHHALSRHPDTGKLQFAFIHGNWALDNSRNDGRWCGVDNELAVLKDAGCYADFTLPSAPGDTQTKKINSIYYATGVDGKSKSHNDGVDVEIGKKGVGDLLLIQGVLCLNWSKRKFGLVPKIENSEIEGHNPPTKARMDLWVKHSVYIKDRPQWRFIKLHTHGLQGENMDIFLGEKIQEMHRYFAENYNDGQNYVLHYVSAREMYNIVCAAEAGEKGNPGTFRDYVLDKPPMLKN